MADFFSKLLPGAMNYFDTAIAFCQYILKLGGGFCRNLGEMN